jgi:hypothetical protein
MAIRYFQCFASVVLALDTIVSEARDRVVVIFTRSIRLARKQSLSRCKRSIAAG